MISTGFGQFQEKTHGRIAPSRIQSKTYPLRAGEAVPLATKASYGNDGKPSDPDLQAILQKDTQTNKSNFLRVLLQCIALDILESTPVLFLLSEAVPLCLVSHASCQLDL